MSKQKELTAREYIKIQDAVYGLSEALNVPTDLIIRIIEDGIMLNIVPFNRFDEMVSYLKSDFHVQTEKKHGFTAISTPRITETGTHYTIDISDEIGKKFTIKESTEYSVAIKEINE